MYDVASVSCQSTKQAPITVHDDKTKARIILEKFAKRFGMEFIVTEVKGRVDGLEGFKVDVEFSLFAFVCDDVAAISAVMKRDYTHRRQLVH